MSFLSTVRSLPTFSMHGPVGIAIPLEGGIPPPQSTQPPVQAVGTQIG